MELDIKSAKAVLEAGMNEAQDFISNPARLDNLLIQLEDVLRQIPVAGETLSDIPLMISLVRSYITKEYTEVSPKVIITMISAFIYVVKKKDIIHDIIPVAGQLDDLTVMKLAFDFVRPELTEYSKWRDARRSAENVSTKEDKDE